MSNFNAMKATLQALTGQQNMIGTPKALVEFVGELDGGTLLSQMIYYSDKGKRRDGFFYKTYEEWHSEIFMSEYRIRKWVKVFKDAEWLETKIKKANGNPTVHYRFNFDTFSVSFLKFLKERNQKNSTNDTLKTSESLTETTTETTTEKEATEKTPVAPQQENSEPQTNDVSISDDPEPPQTKQPDSISLKDSEKTILGLAARTERYQARHSDLLHATAIENMRERLGLPTSMLGKHKKKKWDERFKVIAAEIGGDGEPVSPAVLAAAVLRAGEDTKNNWLFEGTLRTAGPFYKGMANLLGVYSVGGAETASPPTLRGFVR